MVTSDFLTGNGNIAVSRMRNKKYAIWPIFMAISPKFLHRIRNLHGSANTMVTSDF